VKRIFSIVATVLAFGAAMSTASPASAVPAGTGGGVGTEGSVGTQAWWDCPDGYFCAWRETDGNGAMARFQTRAPDLREFNLNDHVWSVWNRTGVVWCAYPDINFASISGTPWPVGNWRGNTSAYGRSAVISSVRRGAC
jgi:peptidase inhibitor family I36